VEAIIAKAIADAANEHRTVYNFGASPPDAAGLIRFKAKWGAQKTVYRTYHFHNLSRTAQRIDQIISKVSRLSRLVLPRKADAKASKD